MVSGIRDTPAEVDRAAFSNARISRNNGLYRDTQGPMSISSNEMKGGNATLRSQRGHGRNEDGGNKEEEFLASDDAVDDGFSRSVLSGKRTSPRHTKQTEASSLPLFTQTDRLTEIQPNVQVLPLASCSLKVPSGAWTASNSQFQQKAEEDPLAEESDVYPPPLTHFQFYQLPQLPNDRSEGRDNCTLDPHFKPEFDLYQPIERAEDARWHGMKISDSRTHGLPAIVRDHTDLSETLDSASSFDQLPSMTEKAHQSKELYKENTHARMSNFVPNKVDTWSDDDVVYGGIHHGHEHSQARSSVPSPLPSHSGFRGQRDVSSTAAFTTPDWIRSAQFSHPLCSQHLNLQNHQLVHPPPLQHHWMSNCPAQLVCAVGNSPQHHHWVPCHHAKLSHRFSLQVIGRNVRQEQLCDSNVSLRKTNNRISKRHPPFPSEGAAPYVLCQHCAQLLQAPAYSPPTHAVTLKLRCGSCWRVSKFGIQQQRMPHMSTPSYADASECSCEASFRFSAPEHVSTVTSGLGEESNSHVHEVSSIWSTGFAANSSPFCGRRPFGNTGLFETNAGALSKTLTGDSVNPSDDNAEIPGRESIFPSATVAGADTHNTVELTHRDSTDGEEAGVLESRSNLLHFGTVSNGEQGNGNCVSSRNDFQRQDAQVPSFSTNDPQRNEAEKEDCPLSCDETVLANSDRPCSPLYKLLGYNSPADLRQRCPSNGPREDAVYSARVSDASNGTVEKLTFPRSTPNSEGKMPCNHQRTSESSGTCAECDLEREWSVDSAHNDDNLYSGSRSPIVATNALLEPELATVKPPTGFFKRSLKGLAERRANFSGYSRQKVIVNGVVLSSAAIKKAEECAGRLRPGCYWYDRKAGFWGVSGGPCVGILPPFIADFHPSLARDCSNGTTKVVVNGRELCQEDLDKLVRRGLSRETRKVYSILHDGTVIDETSGQKLKSLGRLAPTVEHRGKGFGMFMAPLRTT